jgi:pyruvate dehydrogenase E1 component beta subunit
MRTLTYVQAIREAFQQLLASDPRVFVIGQGLRSPWYVGASMQDLDREFGRDRIIDTPVSENATTGAAIGAALAGMRPIVVHPRMDFMLLALDPIVNQAANWSYMFGGQIGVPVVIRPIINRGGAQGAQHSQALHAFFIHVPGIKVVMPASPYDAKGLLIAAVGDGNPVMYIDDRWLYGSVGEVPAEMYQVPIGVAAVRRAGSDLTIVASSWMLSQALAAAETLHTRGVAAEVIDLRSIKPWDRELVFNSVRKTGRLIIADGGWTTGGVAAEIAATVACDAFDCLKGPIRRVALPDAPAPTSRALERAYYPTAAHIIRAAESVMAAESAFAVDDA